MSPAFRPYGEAPHTYHSQCSGEVDEDVVDTDVEIRITSLAALHVPSALHAHGVDVIVNNGDVRRQERRLATAAEVVVGGQVEDVASIFVDSSYRIAMLVKLRHLQSDPGMGVRRHSEGVIAIGEDDTGVGCGGHEARTRWRLDLIVKHRRDRLGPSPAVGGDAPGEVRVACACAGDFDVRSDFQLANSEGYRVTPVGVKSLMLTAGL